jgi:hypothetical protein
MPDYTKFFTGGLLQVIKAVHYMAQPDGTNIEELCRKLRLTRRSIFRLLKTIEHTLNIPFIVHREAFGGTASYRLPASFIEKLSNISLPPVALTFNQAVFVYLILKDEAFPKGDGLSEDLGDFQEKLKLLYDRQADISE